MSYTTKYPPTITPAQLELAGYKMWKPNHADSESIVGNWQKRVFDVDGRTKYFINIKETFGWGDPNLATQEIHNFWPSIQFSVMVNDTDRSIEISLIQWFNESGQWSGITIEDMEFEIEEFWSKLGGLYYDL